MNLNLQKRETDLAPRSRDAQRPEPELARRLIEAYDLSLAPCPHMEGEAGGREVGNSYR